MRVLFSWIDLDNDLKSGSEGGPRVPKTGFIDGPTLQLLNLEKFDAIINCTSLGFGKFIKKSPISFNQLITAKKK